MNIYKPDMQKILSDMKNKLEEEKKNPENFNKKIPKEIFRKTKIRNLNPTSRTFLV